MTMGWDNDPETDEWLSERRAQDRFVAGWKAGTQKMREMAVNKIIELVHQHLKLEIDKGAPNPHHFIAVGAHEAENLVVSLPLPEVE